MWLWFAASFLLSVLFLPGQVAAKSTTKAPVPSQIISAKKVFISNGGSDAISLAAFKKDGDRDKPYNLFYATMKTWGKYELVSTPGEAHLVMEVRFGAPLIDADKLPTYAPQLSVLIFDAQTHFLLWTITEPTEGAYRKATFERNLDETFANVMKELKQLSGESGGN
jgi:hypothetical protein